MIVVLHRPTRAARYIAICRLKQAGCELPSPRVDPRRADTSASISARDNRRSRADWGAKDGDAIMRSSLSAPQPVGHAGFDHPAIWQPDTVATLLLRRATTLTTSP